MAVVSNLLVLNNYSKLQFLEKLKQSLHVNLVRKGSNTLGDWRL